MKNLTKTDHVLCSNCGTQTYGPYFDTDAMEFFDGFYCEDCGLTWYWNDYSKTFQPNPVLSFG